MIAPVEHSECDALAELLSPQPDAIVLARYGRVPQVARFGVSGESPERGAAIVVQTERGEELATVLQVLSVPKAADDLKLTGTVLRTAGDTDLDAFTKATDETEASFAEWLTRAAGWKLQLELIDLERTLDGRLILYVLNDRGAETTRLALLAAAGGFGVVHVQPVAAEGIVQESGGGCGSGGCGSGSGGCATH